MRSLSYPLRGFGSVAVAAEPASPTITVVDNEDGTATVTISGSTASSSNAVQAVRHAIGSLSFVTFDTIVGDGSSTITLTPIGAYFFQVTSTFNTLSSESNIVVASVTSATTEFASHTFADIIAQYLIETAHATAVGGTWPVYVGATPDSPDDTITITDTSGKLDGRIMRTGETLKHEGAQIRVRSFSYNLAGVKARAIWDELGTVHRSLVTVDAIVYRLDSIAKTSSIFSLGVEQDRDPGRQLLTFNIKGTFISV